MRYPALDSAISLSLHTLKSSGEMVDTGHWQGVKTQGKPDLVTKEIVGLKFEAPIPADAQLLELACQPNIPWAEDHFAERVGRVPSNPGEEYKNWPWWHGQMNAFDHDDEHMVFSHTYQERFWPKRANGGDYREHLDVDDSGGYVDRGGIRYSYGDLDDVVDLLYQHPYTRQATFPIFFPEDTGAVHGGRIPCSLHYHFLLRDNKLHLWYPMRSCDAVRHFRDDVYLAGRLCQWVIAELVEWELRDPDKPQIWVDVIPGDLHFEAYSFHVHMGDIHLL